jgi:predicted metal-binding membrane protein
MDTRISALFPFLRQRWPDRRTALPLLAAMGVLVALAWVVTLWQTRTGDVLMTAGVPMSFETGGRFSFSSAFLFLLIWLAMMAAMMFPSAWPVVMVYAAVARRRVAGSVPLFVAGYLLVWEVIGLVAYTAYVLAGASLASMSGLKERLPLLTAAVIVLGGLYQFTPLKRACLKHCQGPLEYLAMHWRDGPWGAFRMGAGHGAYCLGCCSGLMVALIALGAMDLRWMATVSAVIAIEKLGPRHRALPAAVGIGLVLLGFAVALWPRPGMAGM